MTIEVANISSWIWTIAGLVIVFIILRYFLHVVVQILQFLFKFIWHGCITIVILMAIYYLLRALHIF